MVALFMMALFAREVSFLFIGSELGRAAQPSDPLT